MWARRSHLLLLIQTFLRLLSTFSAMSPHNKTEAINHFLDIWSERPETDIGILIIEFLAAHLDSKNLPITTFFEIAKQSLSQDKNAVMNVVNYLSGADLNLLTVEVELIEGHEILILEPEQVVAARTRSIHPISGEIDAELSSKLYLCFTPSETAKKTLRGGN